MNDPDGKNGENGLDATERGGRIGRRRDDRIVGPSEATQRAVEQARAAARDDLPVWLSGPTGSGKEFFARAIHSWSTRRDHPFEVVACASVAEALKVFEQAPPDVLISDIEMPARDGFALIAAVRALPVEAGGDVPAAALTAYSRPEDRAASMMAGYDAHLSKPVDLHELLATVVRLRARRRR